MNRRLNSNNIILYYYNIIIIIAIPSWARALNQLFTEMEKNKEAVHKVLITNCGNSTQGTNNKQWQQYTR